MKRTRAVLYGGLWATMAALTWHETYRVAQARRLDAYVVGLRERQVSAVCRGLAITGGAVLGVNRLTGGPLPERSVPILFTATLAACSVPAVRFTWQYYRTGFRP